MDSKKNGCENNSSTTVFLDELLSYWGINKVQKIFHLLPVLIEQPEEGDMNERRILHELRSKLQKKDWENLSTLLVERMRETGLIASVPINEINFSELTETQQKLWTEIRKRLESDFLNINQYFENHCLEHISKNDFNIVRGQYVQNWLEHNQTTSSASANHVFNTEQIDAISAFNKNCLVIARAGSGKTKIIVNKAFFLLNHCRVPSNQIMLLAFNRKAALNMRKRLLQLLHPDAEKMIAEEVKKGYREGFKNEEDAVKRVADQITISMPPIMTFHSLAYSLVHPEEQLIFDGQEEETWGLSRVIQDVIDDHLKDHGFFNQIKEIMLAFFRSDWERIIMGGYYMDMEDLLKYRRSLKRETLNGEIVKSWGEKIIADFLFEHNVPYQYERNHWWNEVNYRPDFTVYSEGNSGVIIEFFGLQGEPAYDALTEEKKRYWAQKENWKLVDIYPIDIISKDNFWKKLKVRLESEGIKCIRMTDDQIWNRIRRRAVDRFSKTAVSFIGRCRKKSLSIEDLQEKIRTFEISDPVEGKFLTLVTRLYAAYLNRLVQSGEEDFDGLLQKAVDKISTGQTVYLKKDKIGDLLDLKYIFIDEFQDFSDLFYKIVDGIRKKNSNVELFCVGDDWQAINGFAGSELKYFNEFSDYFENTERIYLSTNFRSAHRIVSLGNVLMNDFGKPALSFRKTVGEVYWVDMSKFNPTIAEKEKFKGDAITPAVTRIIGKVLSDGDDVVMLSRRNGLPWYWNMTTDVGSNGQIDSFLKNCLSVLPDNINAKRIETSTVHKFKGLEKKAVILMDAVSRSYPLIHPTWIFNRIFGDNLKNLVNEERRLFYVALTRAVERLFIVTESSDESEFLNEIKDQRFMKPIEWNNFPQLKRRVPELIVRVEGQLGAGGQPTYEIKDLLKAKQFRWNSLNKCWEKRFLAKKFNLEIVKQEIWVKEADRIVVKIYDEAEYMLFSSLIDNGQWKIETDYLDQFINNLNNHG